MQVNSINNSNFGARFVAPTGCSNNLRGLGLAELKQVALDAGLSRDIYKRTIKKIHEIFPSDDFLISLESFYDSCLKKPFHVTVKKGERYLGGEYFGTPKDPKYLPAKFISTCREIAKLLANK